MKTLFLFSLMLLSACNRGENGESGNGIEQTLSGEATLICDQECRDRGQCGLVGQQEKVLLSSTGPATSSFDMVVDSGTTALIIQQRMEPVVQISDQESGRLPFYQVQILDGSEGWVAGWCISQ